MAGSYTRRINLYINGKEVKNDIASIRAEMNKLINEQSRMTRGSREYLEAGKKIRMLDGILQQHREQIKSVTKTWSFENFSQAMNKYFLAISTFVAGFSGLLYSGKKAITMFAEFDDKVSDVRKTTGLTKEQVYALNEELKKLDTRTAQNELLDLGRIAGKLGIRAEKDVEGFIRASDKVVVALKEDLGGEAEEAVRQIGKLVSVFGIRDKFGIEDSITKTGSAINELGMASTANEGYIVNFAKRVAGVAPSARISLQNVLGLAATLDHLGQTSEVSSTAYSQVVTGMFSDTAAYAKAARMSVGDFSKLLKSDANEAFLRLLEGLHNNDAGMEELIKSMGDLDLEGKRAISVIGVLSNNVGLLRKQQALSNREFDKGTSLQEEFNVKNNNAQAILEKKQKILSNLAVELGEKLMPALTVSTSGFTYFVKAGLIMTDFIIKHGAAIANLLLSIAAYTAATKLATLWQNRQTQATLAQIIATKTRTIVENASIAVTQLYAAATMLLTGNIKGATQAMRVFSAVTKLNPVGLLVSMLTLAAGALLIFANRTRQATVQQKALENVAYRANKMYDEQTARIKFLVERIEDGNASNYMRREAINELKKIMPGYNAELSEEGRLINHNTDAIKQYLVMLEMKYRQQAAEEELLDLLKKEMEAKRELDKAEKEHQKTLAANQTEVVYGGEAGVAGQLAKSQAEIRSQNALDNARQKHLQTLTALETMRGEVKKAVQDYQAALDPTQPVAPDQEETENTGGSEPGTDPGKTKQKWSLNNDLTYLKESLKLKQDFNAGVIKTEEELEAALRDLAIRVLKERIQSGRESGEQLLSIEEQLAEKYIEIRKERIEREKGLQDAAMESMPAVENQNREFEEKLIMLRLYGKKREELTALELAALEGLEKEHHQKLAKLDAEAMKDEIERRQQTYETSLAEMRLQHSQELNSITTLEQAKQILSTTLSNEELQSIRSLNKAKKLIQERAALEEQEFTRKHLEDLLAILQQVMGSGDWEGLNLSDTILSEEEKQLLIERINEVKQQLSGLTRGEDEKDPLAPRMRGMSTDILGFSQEDWDIMLQNISDGKIGINDIIMGVKAMINIWQSYYDSITAMERSKLEQFEESVNRQKETLQSNLDNNLISQESYNHQLGKLDEQLDRKKAEFDYKNAVRARNMAIMNAIVNTATAVTSALGVAPPLGIVLAGIVGALGALQIGTIMKTPLPELPGREQGGYLDVKRSQDGRRYRALNAPGKRGYVSTPTVITGEKPGSREYIVSDVGVNNPTVRPVLDILEMARMNGNLATINLPAILESTRTYPGRQQGGYISNITGNPSAYNSAQFSSGQDPAMLDLIRQNTQVMAELKNELQKGIQSKVALHGRGGLYETMDEDQQLKTNANL